MTNRIEGSSGELGVGASPVRASEAAPTVADRPTIEHRPGADTATVAAVIPTTGRDSLVRAVRSALGQGRPLDQVMVACAGEDQPHVLRLLASAGLRTQVTMHIGPDRCPAGRLRQEAAMASGCEWLAFLDDDDYWVSDKVERQLRFAQAHRLDVAASRLVLAGPTTEGNRVVPAIVCEPGQDVSDFLFAKRSLRSDRPLLHTSTLLIRREVLDETPWREDLEVHQDWDLVLRAGRSGAAIGQSPMPLSVVATGTSTSVSASGRWEASFEWWSESRWCMTPRAQSNFLIGQVGRYALSERSWRGLSRVVASCRGLPAPTPGAVLLGLAGLAPRRLFERAVLFHSGAR